MRKMVWMAVLVAVAMMWTLSVSATTLQVSVAHYFNFGSVSGTGTLFDPCFGAFGCPAGPIGDISGTEQFQLMTDVEFDGAHTTYTYVLTNLAANTVSLTALGIGSSGLVGTDGSPAGWTFAGMPNPWAWLCTPDAASGNCADAALPGGAPVSTYSMTLDGLVLPTLQQLAVGFGDPQTGLPLVGPNGPVIVSPADWVATGAGQAVTQTPEPASLALLASGLLGGAWFMRRKK